MIPLNAIAWNLTGSQEMQLFYAAHRSIASRQRDMASVHPRSIDRCTKGKRGRPKRFTQEVLREMHEAYLRRCRAAGDLISVKGLAAHTSISPRTWHRYFAAVRRSP
jgi:hypothetical protein